MKRMFVPDVDLWLALAFESHVHHVAARAWFGSSVDNECAFCRMTQQGFLRLATNPKAFGDEAVSMNAAWELYEALLRDSRIRYLEEPESIETLWRDHTQGQSFSPKVWNDAYLAAFAQATAARLVTFDKGFTQYRGVNCTILT